jgi:hypothetical protein
MSMRIAVRIPPEQEAQAVAILYRHSPGVALPGHTYLIDPDALDRLIDEGVTVRRIAAAGSPRAAEGALTGERV